MRSFMDRSVLTWSDVRCVTFLHTRCQTFGRTYQIYVSFDQDENFNSAYRNMKGLGRQYLFVKH